MTRVVYSARALSHIEQALAFLRDQDPAAPQAALAAVQSAVDGLAANPLIGRRIEGDLRELVISYGQTGYVALYRFVVSKDQIRFLALRHQRELGFQP